MFPLIGRRLRRDIGEDYHLSKCPGGGIGRRAGFRCQWLNGREGSSPFLGTIRLFAEVQRSLKNPLKCATYKALSSSPSAVVRPHSRPLGVTLGVTSGGSVLQLGHT